MGRRIFWTSDDLALLRHGRMVDRMSWNDLAKILGVATQTVIELAERLERECPSGLFRYGEVVPGRNPVNWSRPGRPVV